MIGSELARLVLAAVIESGIVLPGLEVGNESETALRDLAKATAGRVSVGANAISSSAVRARKVQDFGESLAVPANDSDGALGWPGRLWRTCPQSATRVPWQVKQEVIEPSSAGGRCEDRNLAEVVVVFLLVSLRKAWPCRSAVAA